MTKTRFLIRVLNSTTGSGNSKHQIEKSVEKLIKHLPLIGGGHGDSPSWKNLLSLCTKSTRDNLKQREFLIRFLVQFWSDAVFNQRLVVSLQLYKDSPLKIQKQMRDRLQSNVLIMFFNVYFYLSRFVQLIHLQPQFASNPTNPGPWGCPGGCFTHFLCGF